MGAYLSGGGPPFGIRPADHIAKFTIWQTDPAVWPVESPNPQNVDYGSMVLVAVFELTTTPILRRV